MTLARTFIGEYEGDKMKKGMLRELDKNNQTISVYEVKYDSKYDC
jgi:hypothetical protein